MAFKGRPSERAVYNDRFDAMHEGELAAESMHLWCSNGVDRWGYTAMDMDRYDEWREWLTSVTEDELRDWVRAHGASE
ncbi:hypothetical protein SAMN05216207_10155 [Pseudonocardia ammonioxydans]|uniref:Uncharacterized protein n=1 Tax=Pseudonocardia ammonioxydans TaxID=260086 RepID=A0A1I4ZCK4_PSUAM|nr:hypothetical protein [Pseudonocardia ammonioxydans]SFN47986.1 hypothetical protein SAMN05216207_10155 [Pseudonocardia ammonioxydans]